MQSEGLTPSERVKRAIAEYRNDDDTLGVFFSEVLVPVADHRIKTSILRQRHLAWAKANGYRSMSSQIFMSELRRRYDIKRDYVKGNVVVGSDIKTESQSI